MLKAKDRLKIDIPFKAYLSQSKPNGCSNYLLENVQEMSDQELTEAEESEHSVLIATLTREDYKRLIYSGRRDVVGEMLMIAEWGKEAIELWLSLWGVVPDG